MVFLLDGSFYVCTKYIWKKGWSETEDLTVSLHIWDGNSPSEHIYLVNDHVSPLCHVIILFAKNRLGCWIEPPIL